MAKCPACQAVLSDEQIRSLWAARNGEKKSPAKTEAARTNGKKNKGKKE